MRGARIFAPVSERAAPAWIVRTAPAQSLLAPWLELTVPGEIVRAAPAQLALTPEVPIGICDGGEEASR